MLSTLVFAAAEAEATHTELPIPPLAYGGIALALFTLLMVTLWSFRGTAFKHGEGEGAPHGVDEDDPTAQAYSNRH